VFNGNGAGAILDVEAIGSVFEEFFHKLDLPLVVGCLTNDLKPVRVLLPDTEPFG